jgi:hypothetical protein
VAQQGLYREQIDAGFEQVGGKAMTQSVNTLLISCPRRASTIAITPSSINTSKSSGPFG